MMRQHKYIWFVVALVVSLLPSPVLAWSFSVSPPEVEIDNLSPGQVAEFNLTIHNKANLLRYQPDWQDPPAIHCI